MECNRDEALRAKTIAEKKLTDNDFAGAKKFTLKAQTLYPGLDGISHMLITLDVYMSYENKVNNEPDWYGILDVNPSDDDEIIRKRYRKLILMLHPDKNKSIGADGAFRILSEAWNLLSDKGKRSAYNQRRNSRVFQHKVSPQSGCPATGPGGVHTSANRATSKPNAGPDQAFRPCPMNQAKAKAKAKAKAQAKAQAQVQAQAQAKAKAKAQAQAEAKAQAQAKAKAQAQAQAQAKAHAQAKAQAQAQARARAQAHAPSQVVNKSNTFWTICHGCNMHYEYVKMYLNLTILCPKCHKPFHATKASVPSSGPLSSGPDLSSNNNIGSSGNKVHVNVSPSVETSSAWKVEKMKRDGEELCVEWAKKRRNGTEDGGQSSNVNVPFQTSA